MSAINERFTPTKESLVQIVAPALPKPPAKLVNIDPTLTQYHNAVQKAFNDLTARHNELLEKLKRILP